MAEKTEQASPKKLRDARKKGQVARSQDAPAAFTFIVSIATTLIMARLVYAHLTAFLIEVFNSISNNNLQESIVSFFAQAYMLIFKTAFPVMLVTALLGSLVNFVLIGPVFAPEAFKPDIKKFNPITNIKNKFKFKTLFELIKQLFKISGAVVLIYGVVKPSLPVIVETINMPIMSAFSIYASFLMQVILRVGLFFIAVALADLLYQRRNFSKEMMMEKHEVKQEYKNTEGDPNIKGKRKQIAQEIAYSAGPAAGTSKAKAVITNPTHLAIAIAYEPEEYPLPYICALGEDTAARMIVREAERHKIPVLRNIDLAHRLYDEGDIWNFIPDTTYEAVAEILRWIAALNDDTANNNDNNDK